MHCRSDNETLSLTLTSSDMMRTEDTQLPTDSVCVCVCARVTQRAFPCLPHPFPLKRHRVMSGSATKKITGWSWFSACSIPELCLQQSYTPSLKWSSHLNTSSSYLPRARAAGFAHGRAGFKAVRLYITTAPMFLTIINRYSFPLSLNMKHDHIIMYKDKDLVTQTCCFYRESQIIKNIFQKVCV